jgi:hypothetical protein
MGIKSRVKIDRIEFKLEATEELQKRWEQWIKYKTPWTPNIELLFDIIEEENKPNELSRYFSRIQTGELLSAVVIPSHLALENLEMMLNIINLAGRLYGKVLLVKEKENEEYKLKTLFLLGDKSTGLLGNL